MDSQKYYDIVPKDNDPEVAAVLDYITNSAKRHFNYADLEQIFDPIADPDFFLFQTLIIINTKQGKDKLIAETFVEFMSKGFIIEEQQLRSIMSEIEENCKGEAFAMGMAVDLMFHQSWEPSDVLVNINKLLG